MQRGTAALLMTPFCASGERCRGNNGYMCHLLPDPATLSLEYINASDTPCGVGGGNSGSLVLVVSANAREAHCQTRSATRGVACLQADAPSTLGSVCGKAGGVSYAVRA